MNPVRRAAYLRALGVEVWVPKTALVLDANAPAGNEITPPGSAVEFFVQAGTSDTLLLCGSQSEAATVVANDISRSLRYEPVWGWPVPGGAAGGLTLEQAIRDRLITRLIVFGKVLASADGEENPSVIGTAELLCVPSLSQLTSSGKARRALWEALNARQWCASRARVFSLSAAGD